MADPAGAAAPPAPDFVSIVGPPFLGFLINLFLCGILTVQVYLYYMAFSKDQWGIKAIVYSVFILEVVQTAMKCYDRFETDVRSYANPLVLDEQFTSWFSIPILTAVTSAIVQAFFGFRIYVFSKSWIWAALVWLLTLVQLSTGLAQGIISAPLKRSEIAIHTLVTITVWLVSTMVTDVLIAILLSFYLSRLKSGIRKSDKLITKIIRLTVETGTITAVWSIIILVLFYHMPTWMFLLSDSLGKIYANNLMVMFNRRIEFTAHGGRSLQSVNKMTDSAGNGQTDSVPSHGIRVREQTFRVTTPANPQDQGVWELANRGKAFDGLSAYSGTTATPSVKPPQQYQSGWGA